MQSKQIENTELHSDPNNLIFYLTGNAFNAQNFEIIKKTKLKSAFGGIELAIIGSSHYLKLDNYFTEVMTCAPEQIDAGKLIFTKKQTSDFVYAYDFKTFKYEFSVKTTTYPNKEEFVKFEKSLLANKNLYLHIFCKESAITALHFKNTKEKFTLRTWHSYPEHNKLIYSETQLHL